MKMICLLIFTACFSCSTQQSENDLFGEWNGILNGLEVILEVNRDHTVVFSLHDPASGSVETINGDFETDFSKRPVPLTIRNIPQLPHPLHTIISLTEDNTMIIAHFAPRWRLRPVVFDKDSHIELRRVGESKERR